MLVVGAYVQLVAASAHNSSKKGRCRKVTSRRQRVDAPIYAADRQLVEVYVQLVAVSAHSSSSGRQYHAGSYIIGSSAREQDAKGHVACEKLFHMRSRRQGVKVYVPAAAASAYNSSEIVSCKKSCRWQHVGRGCCAEMQRRPPAVGFA
jgi:hypothetical protein